MKTFCTTPMTRSAGAPASRVAACLRYSLLLLVTCAGMVSGQEEMFNFFYQHPFFQGKHWENTSDTINYDLPSSLFSLTLQRGNMTGTAATAIAAMITNQQQLHLMRVDAVAPGNPFSLWTLHAQDPVNTGIQVTSDQVFTLTTFDTNRLDTLVFIRADTMDAGTIYIERISVATGFQVLGRDTIRFTPAQPASRTLAIRGAPLHSGESATCIWVGGSGGMIRVFARNGSQWNQIANLDIDPAHSVTALDPLAVGTASGRIFERSAETFTFAALAGATAIRVIDGSGAAGDNGLVVRKEGSSWTGYTAGTGSYIFANRTPRSAGAGIEMLDRNLNYTNSILVNTQTSLSVSPDSINDYVNRTTYAYNSEVPETLFIRLHDAEANHTLPFITLSSAFGSVNLFQDSNGTALDDMHPDTMPSAVGYSDLKDSVITIILRSNTVSLRAGARTRLFRFGRGHYWQDTLFTTTHAWGIDSDLTIELGSQLLTIANQSSIVGSLGHISAHTYETPRLAIMRHSGQIQCRFDPHAVTLFRIFDLKGRLLLEIRPVPGADHINLPRQIAPGRYYLSASGANGSQQRHSFVITR